MNKYSFEELENMSAEELEYIIDEDARASSKDQIDDDTMLFILTLLEEKGEYNTAPDVEQARISLLEDYLEISANVSVADQKPKRKWGLSILKTACVAAVTIVVMFAVMITTAAAGYDVYEELAKWTNETFYFSRNEKRVEKADTKVSPALENAQQYLNRYGIYAALLPSYTPNGYVLREWNSCFGSMYHNCMIKIGNGSDVITFQYFLMYSGEINYRKDAGNPETYVAGGITHYIMTYNGEYKAVWQNGNVECAIYGVDTYEELIKMIDSIYK